MSINTKGLGFIVLPSLFPEVNLRPTAILALADGTIFEGVSIGAPGHCIADLVLDTTMSGYQESLFRPDALGKILVLSYPHIGSIGINGQQLGNNGHAAGLVVRDCPHFYSHYQATQSLPDFLVNSGIVAIADVDTRRLSRILRGGPQQAVIYVGSDPVQALSLLGVKPRDTAAPIANETLSNLASGCHAQPYSQASGPASGSGRSSK